MNARELRAKRQSILDQAAAMVTTSETENRDFNPEEQTKYNDLISEADSLEQRIKRLENVPAGLGAPNFNKKTGLGDSEGNAFRSYIRDGDAGGLSHLRGDPERGERGPVIEMQLPLGQMRRNTLRNRELRAVDSTMNITTSADGGATVPTGLAPRIAERMIEIRLTERLGCQLIPGVGTTVNHTYENADPVIFATTSEQADNLSTNDYERDAMVLANKAFTLVKKTKKVNLTEELLDDTGENLMDAISSWIGRGIGLTHNSALITEAAASGTSLKTFASATVCAVGELENIQYHDTLGYYLDDGGSIAWVMRPTTFGEIKALTTTARWYDEQQTMQRRTLLEYPVYYSNYPGLTAASAKSVYFGNWYYMGFREDPALRLIRDPYSEDGVVVLKYSFRIVYGVLIAGALGYGVHPSA